MTYLELFKLSDWLGFAEDSVAVRISADLHTKAHFLDISEIAALTIASAEKTRIDSFPVRPETPPEPDK